MSTDIKFKPKHDVIYGFTIKRCAEGQFRNLWSLEANIPGIAGTELIVDNDHLSTVLAKIGYIFERDGF